jgi:hypothetical protein
LSRCIRGPLDSPGTEKIMLPWHETNSTNFAPPVVFGNCLHWNSGCLCSDDGIVVFDTVVESFRSMPSPAGATRLCNRLCDMEGSMGFSCFDHGRTVAKIWVLEDYERAVWSFKYCIKFPIQTLCNRADTKHLVWSHKGDMLVYSRCEGYIYVPL